MKTERPPQVGDKLRDRHGALHHVRAIIDLQEEANGPWYYVVLRYWTERRGWNYIVVDALMIQLYTKWSK